VYGLHLVNLALAVVLAGGVERRAAVSGGAPPSGADCGPSS
jgi:hypothetical protein